MSKKNNKNFIEQVIRVNHAGEFAAKRIYEGQIKYLKNDKDLETVKHMYNQELEHLDFFDKELTNRDIRPTLLMPLWNKLGFVLGAVTAKMGTKSAMACTVAVEEVIEEHYQQQIENLKKDPKEKALLNKIKKFQQEEVEHKEIGIRHDALESPGYTILSACIKKASKCAIWLSKRF
jgi:ubiquinone biosynthesis monooxygenase Coq7